MTAVISQIQVPTDASVNVQRSIQAIKDCLRGLEKRVEDKGASAVTADDLDKLNKELHRLTKKSTYQTWGDVFGSIKNFSFSSSPQSLDADISGQPFRHFTFEGGALAYAQVSVGATAADANEPVGVYAIHNRGIAGADKRLAMMVGNTEGAQNSGNLEFWTMLAGTLNVRLKLTSGGTFVVNMQGPIATNATAGFLAMPQCHGNPSGTPTGVGVDAAFTVYDSLNDRIFVYNTITAAWVSVPLL